MIGGTDPRASRRPRRPQRRPRLGADLELPRRPGRLRRELDPDDPGRYLTPQGYRPFETRDTATIAVKGADPVALTLRWTRHGPVIPGDNFGAAAITPPGHVAALAWTALTAEDRSVGAAIALMRAHSIEEAREAARDYVAPVAQPDPRRPPVGRPPDGRRRPAAPGRQHQPGPHPGAGLARGQRLAGDARLRGEPLRRRSAERHRRQHQQPDHRRRLPRPPQLRLGRHLPHHPRRPAARRPPVSTRSTASSRSRPTPSRRRPRPPAADRAATSGTRASPPPPTPPSAAARRRSSGSRTGTARCREHTAEPLIYAAWVRGAEAAAGPGRARAAGRARARLRAGVHRAGLPQRRRRRRLVRRPADDRGRDLHRHGAPGARRRAARARRDLRRRGSRAGAGATPTRRCTATRPSATSRC